MALVLITREEWLRRYAVAPCEGSAWWGSSPFDRLACDNITVHWPGGDDSLASSDPIEYMQRMQRQYHQRKDGGLKAGKCPPYTHGYDVGYNAVILPDGRVVVVRWFDYRCAANGGDANGHSFAAQIVVSPGEQPSQAQIVAMRELVAEVWARCPNVPHRVANVAAGDRKGMTVHADWFATSCCGPILTPMVRNGVLLPGATPIPPTPGGSDVPTLITVQGVMTLVSPSSGPTHTHVSWVRTQAEVDSLAKILPGQTISVEQCKGIRMVGPCRDDLKGFFHPDSAFSATAPTTVPPHTHEVTVTGRTGPAV